MKNEKTVTVAITNSDLFGLMTKDLIAENVRFHERNEKKNPKYKTDLLKLLYDWKNRAAISGDDCVVFMGTLEYLGYHPSVRNYDRMVVNITEFDSRFQYTYKIHFRNFPRTLQWSELKDPRNLTRYFDSIELKLQSVRELQ